MKPRFILSILATVAVAVASLAYLLTGVLATRTFSDQVTATITAPRSNGLHAGSAVLYRGVSIGNVRSVAYSGGGEVDIEISFDARYQIPIDSALAIENQSMLGESGLSISPPERGTGGPYIVSGQNLTAKVVEVPASVPELLGSTQTLLDQVDPTIVNRLVDTVAAALAGTERDIDRLTPAAQLVAASLIYSEPALVRIIENGTTLMGDSDWIGPSLRPEKNELIVAGHHLSDVITHVKPFADFTDGGRIIGERWLPTLRDSAALVGELVPPIATLAGLLVPTAQQAGQSILGTLNVATLIEQAMKMLPGDSLRLTVGAPR